MKKVVFLISTFLFLLLGFTTNAYADTGVDFGASKITAGTAGYGVVDGNKNGKYYHLSPSNAGIYVSSVTGKVEVTLRKGKHLPKNISTVTVTSSGWYKLPKIPSDAKDYSLLIVYYGANNTSGSIRGTVHDHGDEL